MPCRGGVFDSIRADKRQETEMNTWYIDEDGVLRLVEGDSTETYALKCWAKDCKATMRAGGRELKTIPKQCKSKAPKPFLTVQTIQEIRLMLDRMDRR